MKNTALAAVFAADTECLSDKELYNKAYVSITEARRTRTDKFLRERDKRLSVGAEILLSHALKEFTGRNIALDFVYGANGKPYLKDGGVYFNISHSGNAVMCAVSEYEVGCDIEKISDIDLNIAKKFFSESEYDAIASSKTKEEQTDLFFRYWTLKESFIKATGQGMKLPFNEFEIVLGEKISVCQSYDNRRYCFAEFDGIAGYKAAVAVAAENTDVRLMLVNLNDIVR